MRHSVILANFNGGKYLNEAIRSVLMQQNAEFDLILIDDGSTDSSLEIMRDFELNYPDKIKILVHDENKGQGAGFNSGFSQATGELVSFIDSDDIWYPHKLSAVEQTYILNPDAVLLHHNLHLMREAEVAQELFMDMMAMGDLCKRLQNTQTPLSQWPPFAPTSGLTLPSRVLSKMWPCPEVRFCADMYPTFAAVPMGSIIADYRALGAYRVHSDNNYHGVDNFDAWNFFYREIVPSLRRYFAEAGLVDVIEFRDPVGVNQQGFLGMLLKIADVSPRMLWRQIRKIARLAKRNRNVC